MDSSFYQNGRSSEGDVTMQQRLSLRTLDGNSPSLSSYPLPALPQRSSPSPYPPQSPEPSRAQDSFRSPTPPIFAQQQQREQHQQQQQYQQHQREHHQQQQQQHQIVIHQMEMNAQNAKNKRKQVKRACSNCRRAHAGCDELRPCSRCISKGQESSCEDWIPSPTSYTAPSPPSPKRQRLVSSVDTDSSYGTVSPQHLSSYAGQGPLIRPYPYGTTPQHEKNSIHREANGTDHQQQQQQQQATHHFTSFGSNLAPSPFPSSATSQGHFEASKKPLAVRPPSPAPQHPHSTSSHFLPQQTNGSDDRKYTLTLPLPPSFVSNASPNYSSATTPVLTSPSPSFGLESPSNSGDRSNRLLPSPLYFENQRDSFHSETPSAPSFSSNTNSDLARAQQDLERLNSLLRNRNEEVFNLQQKNRELEERLKAIVGSCNPSECSRQLPTCHGYRERFFPPQHLWGSTPSLLFPQSSSSTTTATRKSRSLDGSVKADSPLSSLMEAASELQKGDVQTTLSSSSENLPSCDSFDASWRFVAGSTSDGDNVNKWFSFQHSNLGRPSIAASCWEWIESGPPSEIKQRMIILKNCNQKFVDTTGYPVSMLAEDFALFDIVPKRVQMSLRSVIDQMIVLNEDYGEVKFIITSYTGREICISASLHLSLNSSSLLVAQRSSQPQLQPQVQVQSHPSHAVPSVPSPHSPFAISPSPQSPAMCCSSLTKSGTTCGSPCHSGEGSGHPPSPSPSIASPSLMGSSSGIRLPSLPQISKPDARPPPASVPSLQSQIQEGCGPFKTNCSTAPSSSSSQGTSKNDLPMITKVETSGVTRSIPAPVPAFKVPSVPSPSPASSSSSSSSSSLSLSLSSSGGPLPGAATLGLLSPTVPKAPSTDRFYQLWIQMIPIDHYDDHYRVGDRVHSRTYRASCEDFCNCSATSAPLRRKRN